MLESAWLIRVISSEDSGLKARAKARKPLAGEVDRERIAIHADHRRPFFEERFGMTSAAQRAVHDHFSNPCLHQQNRLGEENGLMRELHVSL